MVWEWIKRLHAERNLAVRNWQELRDDLAAHKKKMNELTATHAKKIKKMHVNEDAELKTPFFRAAGCCDSGDLFDDALRILDAGGIPGAKATARSRAKRIGMICNRAHDGKFAALLAKELTPSNLFPCSSLLYQVRATAAFNPPFLTACASDRHVPIRCELQRARRHSQSAGGAEEIPDRLPPLELRREAVRICPAEEDVYVSGLRGGGGRYCVEV